MSDIRKCQMRTLFADDDPCATCQRVDECLVAPPLTDAELYEAVYDHYLAPFFEPLLAVIGCER